MKYYALVDDTLDFAPVTDEWLAWYQTRLKCPECGKPRREWAIKPKPIEIRLTREPTRSIEGPEAGPSFQLVHESLALLLLPFVPTAVLHSVVIVGETGKLRKRSEYIAATAPRGDQVDPNRGPFCRHRLCPGCDLVVNQNFRARNGILERYVQGRRAFMDVYGDFYVDADLAEKIRTQKRFSDVTLLEYDTIPEPLDGDVIPGDPGWTGVFNEQPMPKSDPKGRRERKRWMT